MDEYEEIEDEAVDQPRKHPAEHLKAWQFKPGVSGNPNGRPAGSKSLKTFAREYLESLPDDEKIEFMKGMDKIDLWKMAEGNPKQDTDLTSGGSPIVTLIKYDKSPDLPST